MESVEIIVENVELAWKNRGSFPSRTGKQCRIRRGARNEITIICMAVEYLPAVRNDDLFKSSMKNTAWFEGWEI